MHRENIQKSIDYIEDNLKSEFTVEELSEMAGFSLFHFFRLFRTAVGMPVIQYVIRRRLLHGIYEIECGRLMWLWITDFRPMRAFIKRLLESSDARLHSLQKCIRLRNLIGFIFLRRNILWLHIKK